MYKTTKDFLRLKNITKFSWFDCHWCFLRRTCAFRRNRTSFGKGRTVTVGPPHRFFGEHLYAEGEHYLMVTINRDFQIPGFEENEHN